ncbi:MAG: SusD/RagB family nutrient-binding outer membrane lipoprotein [Marinoscillum sp.]
MKNINKILVLVLALLPFACTDNFDEINTDPNEPTEVPAENLFTQAQFSLSDVIWGRAMNFEFGMLMVQHFAQNEYADESRYNQQPSTFSGSWQAFYSGTAASPGGIIDLVVARQLVEADESIAEAVKNNRLAQIAIMKVMAFQVITDTWGAVPYSEAFNPEEFPNPVYDTQEAIYSGLIAEINEAISLITPSATGFGGGDIIYGGDMELWGKLANSVKVRLGMRIADVEPTTASTVVSEAFSSPLGVISSNGENALFTFDADQRIANPFFVDAITRDDFAITEILVTNMRGNDDPRLAEYAAPNSSGNIVGLPYGLTDAASFQLKPSSSRPAESIKEATAPAKLLTYAEVEFFRAEAIERNFITGSPDDAFNNAVEASMMDWGVSEDEAEAYLAANPYNGADWEASVGYEKWVALYTQGLEAWAERRRLDEPSLPRPADAVKAVTMIPVRALYPASEAEANSENLAAVNTDDMITKVWWDVN